MVVSKIISKFFLSFFNILIVDFPIDPVEPSIAISAMDNEDIDNDLKSLTKIMRELKVFGVPTFIYKKERFWGQDRLNYLKNIIDN